MPRLLILILAVGFSSVASRHVNFYRTDYTYVDEFDAFYKLHWDTSGTSVPLQSWSSGFLACDDEGAELFYPKTRDEWTVAKKLVKAVPTALNVTDIFVGIHDKFGVGEFITINGYPVTSPVLHFDRPGIDRCVTMDIESGVLEANDCLAKPGSTRPFVCKKVEDVSCPTIDKGYQYFKETRKCYKVNKKAMNWSKAMETCLMEGGILLVMESPSEADILYRKVVAYGTKYYVGFKKLFNEEYYTVKGRNLRDTGYERWYQQNTRNECGIIWQASNNDGIYMDSEVCSNNYPFICEMTVRNE
ncbi:hypothetical protein ABMA28_004128 [Loxostege sticticalis]|uniref:C-type lectin domain-containing protein n=1 Tax=Loxostege sticticalis TaxID=481309 RepID=A0ABD0SUC6_LOXSC